MPGRGPPRCGTAAASGHTCEAATAEGAASGGAGQHHDGGAAAGGEGAEPLLAAGTRRRPGVHPAWRGRGGGGRSPAAGAGAGGGCGRQEGALRPPARLLPAPAAAAPRRQAALRQAAEEVRQERRQSPAERMPLLGGWLARTGNSLHRSLRGGSTDGIARPLEHGVSVSLSQKTAVISALLSLNHHPRLHLRDLVDMDSPNPSQHLGPVFFSIKFSSAFQPFKSDWVRGMQGRGSDGGLTELKFGVRHVLVF